MKLFNFEEEKDKDFKTLGLKNQRRNLYTYDKQIGKTSKKIDASRKALAPGKRISKNGKEYYERRKNRSDIVGSKI